MVLVVVMDLEVSNQESIMPWKSSDATRHTKKAKSAKCKRAFAHASNSSLAKDGDEGKAVRIGNAAVNKCNAKSKRMRKRGRKR